MTPENFYSQAMMPEMHPLMDLETEVLDNHPEVTLYLEQQVEPFILNNPDSVAELRIVGEPASSKGTLASQVAISLLTNLRIEGDLENKHKKLNLQYVSTSIILSEGVKAGLVTNPLNFRTQAEYDAATDYAGQVILTAKKALPKKEPDKTHVLIEELLGNTGVPSIGGSIITEKEETDEVQNSRFHLLIVSNPDLQRRSYLLRRGLEAARENARSGQEVAISHNTVFDMSPVDALETFGPSGAIRRFTSSVNNEMLKAFREGKFTLPEGTPELLVQGNDPRKMNDAELTEFFTHLTVFPDDDMSTNPIRPWLQRGYYDYAAKEVWGLKNYQIVHPSYLDMLAIHAYPNLLKQNILPFAEYPPRSFSESERREGEIFVSPENTL